MGILKRFATIIEANVNALLDKAEDPEKMADQMLLDLRKDLASVKKETAGVMADEKKMQRIRDDAEKDVKDYTQAAENALKAGNEDDAKELIAKKQSAEAKLKTAEANWQLAHTNAEKMRQMHDKLVSDIENLESRKASIKATASVAKATQHVNEMTSGSKDRTASIEAFDRMEEKANRMLDEANAMQDLNGAARDDLKEKYMSSSDSPSVNDELAEMKARLGL